MSDHDQVRWGQQFADEGSITFPTSRAKVSLVLLGCLAFVTVGLWMVLQREVVPAIIGSLSIAFFGIVGIPILAWRWITRKPIVRIDEEGVSSGERRALWADIEGFRVWSMNGQAAVIAQLTPQAAKDIAARLHPIKRRWDGLGESFVGPSTMSFPSGNGFDPDAMAVWLNSLRHSMGAQETRGLREPERGRPAENRGAPVPDWPRAAVRPLAPTSLGSGFEAEGAPASAVGVMQWTSKVLIEGGNGVGAWDFIDLHGWSTGDMSGVITGLGDQNTDTGDLEQALGVRLGHPISFAPSTWVFSRQDNSGRWTAPLLVVHRSD